MNENYLMHALILSMYHKSDQQSVNTEKVFRMKFNTYSTVDI